VWLLLAACSLVVGELPEPLPEGGPLAGAGQTGGNSARAGQPAIGDGGQSAPGGANGGGSGTSGTTAMCDADGDEHQAEAKCGGDDCDDSDPNVFAGQSEYFDERQKQVDYDYDCSGAPEQEQLEPVVCSGVSVGACPTTQLGFLQTLPPCGESGAWGTCKKTPPLDTCDQQVIDAVRLMRCR
jgi:hypothetical protein